MHADTDNELARNRRRTVSPSCSLCELTLGIALDCLGNGRHDEETRGKR
jgi:hypothetical protein